MKLQRIMFFIVSLIVLLSLAGCDEILGPIMTFQGRLTDASGTPINGNVDITYRFYKVSTGGTPIFTQGPLAYGVNQGLFSSAVGPTGLTSGVTPEDLAEPLWMGVQVGADPEMTPRQRLRGAPYAFSLMPGAVISESLTSGVTGLDAILSIYNEATAATGLPALMLSADANNDQTALELRGPIRSDSRAANSDLRIRAADSIYIHTNDEAAAAATSYLYIYGDPTTNRCRFTSDDGAWNCTGGSTSPVMAPDGERSMFGLYSTEVWFEDFGSAQLVNGVTVVKIDPLFANMVNLGNYHVFLTPYGDCKGLYVANKTADGFEVRELGNGTANISFSYKIVAKRLGKEDQRMPLVPSSEKLEEGSQ